MSKFLPVPPDTPQILVQQRVNSYHISLRGPEDDSFGEPKLDDHQINRPYLVRKAENREDSNRSISKLLNLSGFGLDFFIYRLCYV